MSSRSKPRASGSVMGTFLVVTCPALWLTRCLLYAAPKRDGAHKGEASPDYRKYATWQIDRSSRRCTIFSWQPRRIGEQKKRAPGRAAWSRRAYRTKPGTRVVAGGRSSPFSCFCYGLPFKRSSDKL